MIHSRVRGALLTSVLVVLAQLGAAQEIPKTQYLEYEPLAPPRIIGQTRASEMLHLFGVGDHGGGPTRTMLDNAEAKTGPTWAVDNDARVTRVGRFLRASRLDEIPQLWMVLRGDMSLIGPRPERPEFIEQLSREIPHYHLRHTIRPGVTGWAQIRYQYGSSVAESREKLQYDLFYIKNMSPGLDFLILFHSIKIILLGRGAK